MPIEIDRIYLSKDLRKKRNLNVEDDNTDVIVKTKHGETYIAPFFAYQDIPQIFEKNRLSGAYLKGQYFWVANMVLIQECTLEKIEVVVNELINEGDFSQVFTLL